MDELVVIQQNQEIIINALQTLTSIIISFISGIVIFPIMTQLEGQYGLFVFHR